jgi:hypothetical protein
MKKIILFCCLFIITLFSGCIQQNLGTGPMHTSPAPAMPSLSLSINPNPAPENSKATIIVKFIDAKKANLPNELVYINLTKELTKVQVIDNIVHGGPRNLTITQYQVYTNDKGEAKLDIDIPPVSWHEDQYKVYINGIKVDAYWKNASSYISQETFLPIIKTGPPAQIESMFFWSRGILKANEKDILTITLNPQMDLSDFYGQSLDYKGTLYNLSVNVKIIKGSENAYLSSENLYTNIGGQAFVDLIPTNPGVVVIQATYQNLSKIVNDTIIPSQIPLLPPEPYTLTINANPNPATAGNNVTITAKLTQNDIPLQNQQIIFYMMGSTNIVGSTPTLSRSVSYTNSNGEAMTTLYALRAGEDKVATIWGNYSNMITVTYQ